MVIITESSTGQCSSRGPFNLSFLPVTKRGSWQVLKERPDIHNGSKDRNPLVGLRSHSHREMHEKTEPLTELVMSQGLCLAPPRLPFLQGPGRTGITQYREVPIREHPGGGGPQGLRV